MREFFRGWKRKVGLLMLAIACVSMSEWFRSRSSYDTFNIPFGSGRFAQFGAADQHFIVGWMSVKNNSGQTQVPASLWASTSAESKGWCFVEIGGSYCSMGISPKGFSTGISHPVLRPSDGNEYHVDYQCRLFPCGAVVVPITVLSAWLLLSTIRNPKPQAGPTPPKA